MQDHGVAMVVAKMNMSYMILLSLLVRVDHGYSSSPTLPCVLNLNLPEKIGANYYKFGIMLLGDEVGNKVRAVEVNYLNYLSKGNGRPFPAYEGYACAYEGYACAYEGYAAWYVAPNAEIGCNTFSYEALWTPHGFFPSERSSNSSSS